MIGRIALCAAIAALLAGCAGGSRPAAPRPAIATVKARSSIVVVPQVMAGQGLGGVIGSLGGALTSRFGTPRIDLVEGDARKLQFAGSACVLDIYLYPAAAAAAAAAEPTATHIEARLRQGGAPADPSACIREIEGR
jgi:hypothetical protein